MNDNISTAAVIVGGSVGAVLVRIFGGMVAERVLAKLAFKVLLWVSIKTTNNLDNELVKEAYSTYYSAPAPEVKDA